MSFSLVNNMPEKDTEQIEEETLSGLQARLEAKSLQIEELNEKIRSLQLNLEMSQAECRLAHSECREAERKAWSAEVRASNDSRKWSEDDMEKLSEAKATVMHKAFQQQFIFREKMYLSVTFVLLLYGCLVTVFQSAHSESFMRSLTQFGNATVDTVRSLWQILFESTIRCAATISLQHAMLLQAAFCACIFTGISVLIWLAARRLMLGILRWFRANCTDRISVTVYLAAFATIVFFADPISQTPINLIIWMLLIDGAYIFGKVGWQKAKHSMH